jgi:hypothetical protein
VNWLEHHNALRLRWVSDCQRFVIAAVRPPDVELPWWEAKDSAGKDVASGYGDDGLAKCKAYCAAAAQRQDLPLEQPADQVAATEKSAPESFVRAPVKEPEPQASLF